MPFGMRSRHNSNVLPKTATLSPRPRRCAAVERPYGPAPTTTASYCAMDTACREASRAGTLNTTIRGLRTKLRGELAEEPDVFVNHPADRVFVFHPTPSRLGERPAIRVIFHEPRDAREEPVLVSRI